MNAALPRYVETRPGEAPDAYVLEGSRVVPLSRMEGSVGTLPLIDAPLLPDELLATIMLVSSTMDRVDRAHGAVSNLRVTLASVAPTNAMREGALALHRAEIERRNSAP